ncbi:MAG: beta-propeller domain-containing protein [Eubacteriales bacterium]
MKKLFVWVLTFALVFSISPPVFAAAGSADKYDLALYIGSPLTVSSGVIKALDSDNPNVAPIIYKSRTLVPIRAIAEHFGAVVSFDAVKKAAVINYNGGKYTFFAGKNYYTKEIIGKSTQTFTYDTEMLIIENRSMVPLRVICEKVLGKTVDYSQNIITVGSSVVNLATNTVLKANIKDKIGQAVKITSLAQLKSIIATKMNYYSTDLVRTIEIQNSPADVSGTAPSTAPATTPALPAAEGAADQNAGKTTSTQDFSTTNNQVLGVDEADVIKTDGNFIYIAGGGFVKIVKAENGIMTLVDTIKMPIDPRTGMNINISELYIDKGRLVVLGSLWRNDYQIMTPTPAPPVSISPAGSNSSSSAQGVAVEKSIAIYPPIWQGKNFTYCAIYSVDTNGKTKLLKELSVEGSMLSSRKSGDTVYLMTNKYFYYYSPANPGEIVPMYKDSTQSSDYKSLPIDKIMCYPESPSPQYLMVAAVDIMKTDEPANIEAILGSGSTVFMNENNLYIAQADYSGSFGEMTAITKYSINGTKLGFAGGGKVQGTLLNQFSMDEFDGNLRVATTGGGSGGANAVYVLDTNLNQIGALENMAKGDRIYAVRFMGNKGYIVTFRQIDPLFVIDLSTPTSPKVVGELKVPGFSNFLYPIGENLILGVGQGMEDVYSKDESGKEIVIGTRQTGIKFSIFDVADQGKPKELQTYTVGDSGSYSEILNNHKALMMDQKDNILAFEATVMDSTLVTKSDISNYFSGAVVLTYDATIGFKEKGRIAYETAIQNSTDMGYYSYIRRLCYIGNVLYYIQDSQVRSFNMQTLEPISTLK